ncbi:hypothetical protein V8G54_020263 [Vigna mungo]|uniref:Uncharacterized protein n=1 Tax=Vigna mungo TaxID=3915 RepID=A0AAQ3RUJ5_VIGMU
METMPSLSLSIFLNISLMSSTSSLDKKSAMTLRAFLLNLFIIENCLSLDLTTSPSGTLGAFLAFWSQGCSSTCLAVNRSLGSGSNICLTRLLALSEILGQGSLLKSISPRRMACATPCSDSAQNGGTPHSKM